jgi:medium-chain acyl-[acyl-carrier-protein] hydrolase
MQPPMQPPMQALTPAASPPDRWLVRKPAPQAKLRLYCFAYAGGSAHQFLPWQAALGPDIEVAAFQLPGRGPRLAEPPIAAMAPLLDALAARLAAQLDSPARLPFAFFGHSLGGLLAFELARLCQRRGMAMPERIVVSACNAPRGRPAPRMLHRLDDAGLVDALRDYNGTPPAALADPELMALLLPAIRADFALVENYQYLPGPLLDVPLTVLAGRADRHVQADRLPRWREETHGAHALHTFDGGHFFIHEQQRAVVDCIRGELDPLWRADPATSAAQGRAAASGAGW